jgi:HAD superfamily hydrolase (TIGR01509 family)
MTAGFEAIIFDFDGVILDTESTLYTVWAELFGEFGCSFSEEEYLGLVGSTGEYVGPDEWLIERANQPIPTSEELLTKVSKRHRMRVDELLPMPGVVDWLDEAGTLGLALGVASSSPMHWVEPYLLKLGLRDRFGTVICAGPDFPSKPAPDVYLAACASLGVKPARSIAIEDSYHGVSSALAAGMTVIAVPNAVTTVMDLSGAHHVVHSLSGHGLASVLSIGSTVGNDER